MKLSCDRVGSKAAYIVCIGRAKLYFSYQTLVGFELDDLQMRTNQHFSQTTLRHLHDLGISGFPAHAGPDFRAAVESILTSPGAFT